VVKDRPSTCRTVVISFFRCVLWLNDTSYSKVCEEVNRKCPVRNTTVQLLLTYNDHELHNAQRYIQMDRQTDDVTMSIG